MDEQAGFKLRNIIIWNILLPIPRESILAIPRLDIFWGISERGYICIR
jgi:hypothetical protein